MHVGNFVLDMFVKLKTKEFDKIKLKIKYEKGKINFHILKNGASLTLHHEVNGGSKIWFYKPRQPFPKLLA